MDFNKKDQIIKQVTEAFDQFAKELSAAKAAILGKKLKIEALARTPTFEKFEYPESYLAQMGGPDAALLALERDYAAAKAIHDSNAVKIVNNKACRDAVTEFMHAIGFADKEMVPSTSRKRYAPSHVSATAGWLITLNKQIPVTDGWDLTERSYAAGKKAVAAWQEKIDRQQASIRLEEEQKKKNANAWILSGQLSQKYGFTPEHSSIYAVFEWLLEKDKYLKLAHYLLMNRGSWVDGHSLADIGLRGFTCETGQDKEVFAEISGLCDDWCGDGRIFRDCTWNYDRLFAIAEERNPELVKDYRRAVPFVDPNI